MLAIVLDPPHSAGSVYLFNGQAAEKLTPFCASGDLRAYPGAQFAMTGLVAGHSEPQNGSAKHKQER